MEITNRDCILITEPVRTDKQAIDRKMKLVQTKLFGIFTPVTYELVSQRKVYIPYELHTYSYQIRRGKDDKKGFFDRSGEVGIVFDLNEVHAFHFDLLEQLAMKKMDKTFLDGDLLADGCSPDEAVRISTETVRWKILHRTFRDMGEVNLVKQTKFYRPAWELKVTANNREFYKYAYLDNYGSENEHVAGLRVRLNT